MKNKAPKLTVKYLRQTMKAKVLVCHSRRYKTPAIESVIILANVPKSKKISEVLSPIEYKPVLPELQSKGGETKIVIDLTDGRHYEANTLCSEKDSYNKRRGVQICLARIEKDMQNSEV